MMEDGSPEDSGDRQEVTRQDLRMATEIAEFVAERAFDFEDHECRAWALTDFETWASLSGHDAELMLMPRDRTDKSR